MNGDGDDLFLMGVSAGAAALFAVVGYLAGLPVWGVLIFAAVAVLVGAVALVMLVVETVVAVREFRALSRGRGEL